MKKVKQLFWESVYNATPMMKIGMAIGWGLFIVIMLTVVVFIATAASPIDLLAGYIASTCGPTRLCVANFGAGLFLMVSSLITVWFLFRYSRTQLGKDTAARLDELQSTADSILYEIKKGEG